MNPEVKDRSKFRKLGWVYRSLAGFILFCAIGSGVMALLALYMEGFHYSRLYAISVAGVSGYVAASILFTGYAPGYLLTAHPRSTKVDKGAYND
jgi:hypothetical protein